MSTDAAYDTDSRPRRRAAVGIRPAVMSAIRAALIARGSSLRQWAYAWAASHGEEPGATYTSVRMAIQRRLARQQPPLGPVALRLIRALREDLGVEVVPDFGEAPVPGAANQRSYR